jgi:hypothetical protein
MNIDKAEQPLKEDRKLSLRELSDSLFVSLERALHIVTVELDMSRVYTVWVPRDLRMSRKEI